jgi:hypothetical protein
MPTLKPETVCNCQVGRNIVKIKLLAENPGGGWQVESLKSGKLITVKDESRLTRIPLEKRKEKFTVITENDDKIKVVYTPHFHHHLEFHGNVSETGYRSYFGYDGSGDIESFAKELANLMQAEMKPKKKTKRHTTKPCANIGDKNSSTKDNSQRPENKFTLIEAAILIMQGCERPLSCGEIVSLALETKIWSPKNGGRTPANTLYSSILRKIKNKGKESRFIKVEKGKFELSDAQKNSSK